MATFNGPFQFNGSLGQFRSYRDRDTGKQIISTKRTGNKNLIKNNPNLERVKDMNREFQACNIWAKLIRIKTDDLSHLKMGRINGKLVSIAKRIQLMCPPGQYGFRSIESSKFNFPLTGFCMNNAHPFKDVCCVEPEISITDDRREVTLRLTNFRSHEKFKWTERIFYYRVYLNIFELPDVEWDAMSRQYFPVYHALTLGKKTTISDWISVSSDYIDFQISASFDEDRLPREKTVVVASLGFEFASSMQNNTPYIVKDNGTMAIVGCF